MSDSKALGRRRRGTARPRRGPAAAISIEIPRPALDFATIAGVAGAGAIIAAAMVIGGMPGTFVDVPALLIVFGGTFLVTVISFSFDELKRTPRIFLRSLLYIGETPHGGATTMLSLAESARQRGSLALTKIIPDLPQGSLLGRAIELIADGLPAEQIEHILTREIAAKRERHERAVSILRRAGEVAPAMGLIGTLIGLVQMLGRLDDPSTIGPAMAVALLTTFYGAVLANMVLNPLAGKLERNSFVEGTVDRVYALGALSIARKENPRRLEMAINTLLPPDERLAYFD